MGRNAISISAGRRLVACSSRWARPPRPLVCGRGSPDVQIQAPRPGQMPTSARTGSAAPVGGRRERRGSPVCATEEQIHFVRRAKLPNHGVREMPKPAQVATRTPANAKDRSAADAVEPNRRRFKPSTAFCRQRWCAGRSRDCEAVQRLSTQVVGNTRRKISPMTTRHVACKVIVDACQEYE